MGFTAAQARKALQETVGLRLSRDATCADRTGIGRERRARDRVALLAPGRHRRGHPRRRRILGSGGEQGRWGHDNARALPPQGVRLAQGPVRALGPLRRAHPHGRRLGPLQRREGRARGRRERACAARARVLVRVRAGVRAAL
jgi:hypothetical protein